MISTCPKCDKPVSVPAGVDASAAVRCPLCNAEYALAEALAPPPPELILVSADVQAVQPSPAFAEEAAAETAHPPEEAQPVSEVENEAATVAAEFPAKPVPPWRRRKPKSALQTLIEIVAGGLAGCLVAYYGLAFYYGPEFAAKGLPILPLPGIEWITTPHPAADAAKENSPEKKPAKGKPKAASHEESAANSFCPPTTTGHSVGINTRIA